VTDQIEAVEAIEPELLPEQVVDELQPTEGEEAEVQPEPKPKKTAQDRINEVTAARREAERERDYWRNAAMQAAPAAPEKPRDAAPNPDDYALGDVDVRYVTDVAKYEAKAEVRAEYQAREESQRRAFQVSTFDDKVAQIFPDGEPDGLVSLRSLPALRGEISDVILSSEKGPLLADHLGDNPAILRRLESLPAHMIGFELAKIESSLGQPAPSPNRVTNAPAPAPKPRGSGGQFAVAPDTNDFAAFEKLADKVRLS